MRRLFTAVGVLAASVVIHSGCGIFESDLARARTAYEEARYEDAQVWLDDLAERDDGDLAPRLRAQLAYLQGMTAYRLERRRDARYFLGLAQELAGERPEASLGSSAAQTLERTVADLEPSAGSAAAGAPAED